MGGFRLMAVHAHPDDESSKGAATMARYAAEGHEVLVVTLTGGERGDILNPAMDIAAVRDNLPTVRREEMARAAHILGVRQMWLGFVDSGLPEGDPLPPLPDGCFAKVPLKESTEALVRVVREFRPHVITTYDENGGYPHPDHIRCHEVSVAAFDAAPDPDRFPEAGPVWEPKKLYYVHGFLRQRMQVLNDAAESAGRPGPYAEWLAKWPPERGRMLDRVTTRVDSADYFDRRDAALLAHRTQIDPNGLFFASPIDDQKKFWPTEEFELAATRVPSALPETDLFAGLDPSDATDGENW